jgi:type I restriction enzyme S subunit
MSTSQDFANWVCGDALDPDFLMHALIRSRAELRAIATGATHKTIYMPALNSFHICLPSREAQGEIVRKLTAQLDANKAIHASAKENLTLLQELQSHAFAQVFEQSKSAR